MQGVQVAPAINDENSARGPLLHSAFKENASFQAPAKQGSVLKSARKAFGNITNTRSDAAAQQPAGTVVKRRAFGDITNSTIKQQPGAASAKKADPFSSQLKPSSIQAPVAPGVAAAEAVVTAPWWETAEPERPAGKTWEQLLADKEKQEDAEIERSVQQLLFGFRDLTARCFQVSAAAVLEAFRFDDEQHEQQGAEGTAALFCTAMLTAPVSDTRFKEYSAIPKRQLHLSVSAPHQPSCNIPP
jgi:hypothetical protein